MPSSIYTFVFNGLEPLLIDVQVLLSKGLPSFIIVGLPDKTIAESKERIRASLITAGIPFPAKRIIVNLSPANIFKEGSHYDLPIMLGLLREMGVLRGNNLKNYIALGELSLDGSVVAVNGALSAFITAKKMNKGLICSYSNGSEAKWFDREANIIAVNNVAELLGYFNEGTSLKEIKSIKVCSSSYSFDMTEVIGQPAARRAIEIAAAGRHNILMIGPPGTGKSMLANRMTGLLPDLLDSEILENNMIASIIGDICKNGITSQIPFRNPHHSCSAQAMIGGGRCPKPGESTMAHNGILFLDELSEFPRNVLDALRQPIENHCVVLSRVHSCVTYPADFQFVAAMNPCRCGYFGDPQRECDNTERCARNYCEKISGPILDRIDIIIVFGFIDFCNANYNEKPEPSSIIRERVLCARDIQKKRYCEIDINVNGRLKDCYIQSMIDIEDDALNVIKKASYKYSSMRGLNKTLKVARTVADLENSKSIKKNHALEALSYSNFVIYSMKSR